MGVGLPHFPAQGGTLLEDHGDEAIGEYEVGVDLDDEHGDADVEDLHLRVDHEHHQGGGGVDGDGQQLEGEAVLLPQ
jgi:hypothetical protein